MYRRGQILSPSASPPLFSRAPEPVKPLLEQISCLGEKPEISQIRPKIKGKKALCWSSDSGSTNGSPNTHRPANHLNMKLSANYNNKFPFEDYEEKGDSFCNYLEGFKEFEKLSFMYRAMIKHVVAAFDLSNILTEGWPEAS